MDPVATGKQQMIAEQLGSLGTSHCPEEYCRAATM
jgi:hypothetical protein